MGKTEGRYKERRAFLSGMQPSFSRMSSENQAKLYNQGLLGILRPTPKRAFSTSIKLGVKEAQAGDKTAQSLMRHANKDALKMRRDLTALGIQGNPSYKPLQDHMERHTRRIAELKETMNKGPHIMRKGSQVGPPSMFVKKPKPVKVKKVIEKKVRAPREPKERAPRKPRPSKPLGPSSLTPEQIANVKAWVASQKSQA